MMAFPRIHLINFCSDKVVIFCFPVSIPFLFRYCPFFSEATKLMISSANIMTVQA